MICVALNGGEEPTLGTPATPTFSDVRGTTAAWAEKYIESCVAQGIVSGVGGGRFCPRQQPDRHPAGQDAAGVPWAMILTLRATPATLGI